MAEKIKVLLVNPMERPKLIEIEYTLETLQKLVGGYIEVNYPWADEVGLISCEEAKLNGSMPNRCLEDDENNVYDIIFGSFIIAGLTDESFGSLSDEMADKYSKKFAYPEAFFLRADNELICRKLGCAEPLRVLG